MNENRISIVISDADKTAIEAAIAVLQTKLAPYLIALNSEDKKNLAKLGDKSVPFADKGVQYSGTNPEFMPAYISRAEVLKDYEAFKTLNGFLAPLMQITGNVEDTATLCGSEALTGFNGFYGNVRQGVKLNVPGAKAIYDDMSVRFEAQKARHTKPEPHK